MWLLADYTLFECSGKTALEPFDLLALISIVTHSKYDCNAQNTKFNQQQLMLLPIAKLSAKKFIKY